MDYQLIINSIILILVGIFFLRISGRKSISQMTIAQVVIMISIGSLIVQPIANKSVLNTVIIAAVFVSTMLILEFLQIKVDFLENLLTGKAKVVIKNGELQPKELKKLRITVDQLEMRLRQKGISKITDVQMATIESNGQLGYELNRYAQTVTIGELEQILSKYLPPSPATSNIFNEINNHTSNNNTTTKLK